MIIYLAGADTVFFPKEHGSKKNLHCARLGSFYYLRDTKAIIKNSSKKTKIFLDSGAFSAKTQNKEINIDDYAEYIKSNIDRLTTYVNLDVIGDAKSTKRNQKYLESIGLTPIPVFHFLSDFKHLEKYLKNHDHIAIGGLVHSDSKEWLDHIWDKYLTDSKGNAKVKVHGFGVTNHSLIVKYPWHSVDSTTWIMAASMGEICYPVKRKGVYRYDLPPFRVGVTEDSLNRNSLFKSFSKHQSKEIMKYIEHYNFTLGTSKRKQVNKDYKLKERERWVEKGKIIEKIKKRGLSNDYMLRRYINAIYFMNLQEYLTTNVPRFKKTNKLF